MKFFPFILLLLFFSFRLNAQTRPTSRNTGEGDGQDDSPQPSKIMVESHIQTWSVSGLMKTLNREVFDSTTINFHTYNPIFKKSISNTYLGYLGAPYQSNLFFDREDSPDFYFLKFLSHYHKSQDEVTYYNTTTPFSNLKYVQGNQQGNKKFEQLFTAFYTQNIDPSTNFGFRYDALKNQGQYNYQESLHEHFNLFLSRNSERYNGYFSFLTGTNRVVENGGISDSLVDMSSNPDGIMVKLSNPIDVSTTCLSVFTSHEYLLGSLSSLFKKDTLSSSGFIPAYSLQYSLEYSRYNRQFQENSVDRQFFDTTYFSTGNRIDSTLFNRFTQVIQLKAFENPYRKFTFGKKIFLENEIVEASHPVAYGQSKYSYANLYLGGELYSREGKFWNWDATARIAVLGRNIGDAMIRGSIRKPIRILSDTTFIIAEGWYRDQEANIFLEHWNDNHFKWENSFKKQHEVIVKGKIFYPRFHLQAGLNYALLSNYIFFNQQALPDQYNREFSVVGFWLDKDFHLGPFCWANKLALQHVSDSYALRLPLFSGYSSLSFSGVLFKVMKYQLGAEIYYHTPFLAESYQPSTTTFFLQDERMIGGFPYVNVFLNAKLKRTSAFVMYQHANSWISDGSFFGATGYPINQAALRFGFFWTFYD